MSPNEQELESLGADASEREKLAAALVKLRARCDAAHIQYEDYEYEGITYLTILLPNGREKRPVVVQTSERAVALSELPFEQYVVLGDYVAICHYEQGLIEASIRGLGTRPVLNQLSWRLFQKPPRELREHPVTIQIPAAAAENAPTIRIHSQSRRLTALFERAETVPSIGIEGLQVATHDQAVTKLERIAEAVFFQLDFRLDLSVALARERVPVRGAEVIVRRTRPDPQDVLTYPISQYDSKPASLYWYGRSATGMPLLQFLAYYQCIEYYFPVYAQREAIRRTRNAIKNPAFSVHNDSDMIRLLSTIQIGRSSGLGDERAQLRATILECVDADDLRLFLTAETNRKDFFVSHYKPISDVKIPLAAKDADLRNEVADRIYAIRCRIVHTKVAPHEGQLELLLPFSKEADLLTHDIELVRYVARQALVAASAPLSL